MYRSILAPLDGSRFAERALPVATAIAARTGAVLHLVRAHLPGGALQYAMGSAFSARTPPDPGSAPRGEAEPGRAYLAAMAARWGGQAVRITTRLLEGPHVGTLVDYSDEVNADLVVIATHARGPLLRAWTGSVARGLVRHCRRPCLLIAAHAKAVAMDAGQLFRHVLIPLDGSSASQEIVPHAVSLGTLSGAHYTLLHVLPAVPAGHAAATQRESLSVSELEERAARAMLERVASRLQLQSPTVKTATRRHAHTATAIRDYAAAHAVDLVAMTTYGAALTRMLLGNVSDRVTRFSPIPVLLYRPSRRTVRTRRSSRRTEASASNRLA